MAVAKFDWNQSNGYATAEQTQAAYRAITNHEPTRNFPRLVWTDIVDKINERANEDGRPWRLPQAGSNSKYNANNVAYQWNLQYPCHWIQEFPKYSIPYEYFIISRYGMNTGNSVVLPGSDVNRTSINPSSLTMGLSFLLMFDSAWDNIPIGQKPVKYRKDCERNWFFNYLIGVGDKNRGDYRFRGNYLVDMVNDLNHWIDLSTVFMPTTGEDHLNLRGAQWLCDPSSIHLLHGNNLLTKCVVPLLDDASAKMVHSMILTLIPELHLSANPDAHLTVAEDIRTKRSITALAPTSQPYVLTDRIASAAEYLGFTAPGIAAAALHSGIALKDVSQELHTPRSAPVESPARLNTMGQYTAATAAAARAAHRGDVQMSAQPAVLAWSPGSTLGGHDGRLSLPQEASALVSLPPDPARMIENVLLTAGCSVSFNGTIGMNIALAVQAMMGCGLSGDKAVPISLALNALCDTAVRLGTDRVFELGQIELAVSTGIVLRIMLDNPLRIRAALLLRFTTSGTVSTGEMSIVRAILQAENRTEVQVSALPGMPVRLLLNTVGGLCCAPRISKSTPIRFTFEAVQGLLAKAISTTARSVSGTLLLNFAARGTANVGEKAAIVAKPASHYTRLSASIKVYKDVHAMGSLATQFTLKPRMKATAMQHSGVDITVVLGTHAAPVVLDKVNGVVNLGQYGTLRGKSVLTRPAYYHIAIPAQCNVSACCTVVLAPIGARIKFSVQSRLAGAFRASRPLGVKCTSQMQQTVGGSLSICRKTPLGFALQTAYDGGVTLKTLPTLRIFAALLAVQRGVAEVSALPSIGGALQSKTTASLACKLSVATLALATEIDPLGVADLDDKLVMEMEFAL